MAQGGSIPPRTGRVLTPLDVQQDLQDTLVARAYVQRLHQTLLDVDMPLRYDPPVPDDTDKPASTGPKFFHSTNGSRVRQDKTTRSYKTWSNR